MLRRAALLLLLALPGAQADADWLSVKEWYATCTLTYTYSGEIRAGKNGETDDSEWTETETVSLESVLDTRSPTPNVLRKGQPPILAPVRGRWQAWHPGGKGPRPTTFVVSGEGDSGSSVALKGEGGLLIRDTARTQKSRIHADTMLLALVRITVDRDQKTYALAAPLMRALATPGINTLESSWTEHSQPTGVQERSSGMRRGSFDIVGGTLGKLPDVEWDASDILVFDRPLPDKVGPLAGTAEIPIKPSRERRGKVNNEVRKAVLSWVFSPTPPPPMELEIDVVGASEGTWPDWRPKGHPAGIPYGGYVDIAARIVGGGSGPLPDRPQKITLRLADVSNEPGVCMNYPPESGDAPRSNRADLRFIPGANGDVKVTDHAAMIIKPAQPEIQARLASYDYGGWADVMAEAHLESGRILVGHVKGQPGERKLLVPDRDKTSKIARVWKSPGKDKEDLDDQPPGDGQSGDGFSNYEEYRGFMVGGIWKAGDPAKKEIFIVNKTQVRAAGGVDLFEKISKLRVHRLDPSQMRSDRVVNFNHGYAHAVDQHGLRIFYDPTLQNQCWAETDDGRPGRPKDNIGDVHVGTFDNPVVMTMEGTTLVPRRYADPSLAHELLHCCNVYHHGDKPGDRKETWVKDAAGDVHGPDGPIQVFDEGGRNITTLLTRGNSLNVGLQVHEPGGRASGDVGCVMRYDNTHAYRVAGKPDVRVRLGPVDPPEVVGGGLCSSAAATATNVAPGRMGAADGKRGNCASQIVVNDAATRTDRQ